LGRLAVAVPSRRLAPDLKHATSELSISLAYPGTLRRAEGFPRALTRLNSNYPNSRGWHLLQNCTAPTVRVAVVSARPPRDYRRGSHRVVAPLERDRSSSGSSLCFSIVKSEAAPARVFSEAACSALLLPPARWLFRASSRSPINCRLLSSRNRFRAGRKPRLLR